MRILVALLLLVPAVQGVDVLQDASGDVQAQAQGTGQPLPGDAYAALDLVGLVVEENIDDFVFTVQVADLKPPGEERTEGGAVRVQFAHEDMEFRLEIGRSAFFGGEFAFANLFGRAGGGWGHLWSADAVGVDTGADTLTVAVPRTQLADSSGAPPYPGRVFTAFSADSASFLSNNEITLAGSPVGSPVAIVDRMPDGGTGAQDVEVRLGLAQTGHARLFSEEPRRASNGEASTFVFRVNATNIGDREAFFTFSARDVPSNWQVSLPQPAVTLAAGASQEVPVVLSTPFAHQHGSFATFILEMTDTEDPDSVGRVELGVTYLETPQPAGHHDTVYFHSRAVGGLGLPVGVFGGAQAYMNAAEEHSGDAGVDVRARNWGINVRSDASLAQYRWYIPLDPGLRMGLDFDTTRTGSVTVPVATTAPQPGATLEGRLLLVRNGMPPWSQDARIDVLGTFASPAVEMAPQASHTYTADVQITRPADLVRYDPTQNLVLELFFNATRPPSGTNADAPVLTPGGSLTLPLFEYRDPVSGNFGDGVRLTAPATTHTRNPGATALFRVELQGPAGRYDLRLAGVNAEWATVIRDRVDLGESATVDVVVRVPSDALDGDRADLVLQASGEGGTGLLRLVVDVDTDAEHPDDAGAVPQGESQQAPLPLLAFAALAVLAARRRA